MTTPLIQQLSRISQDPGVYLMKDLNGTVIYVGKAVDLKKRLASYFTKAFHADVKTGILVKKIASFETIITGTEKEALILESNLIKKHRPRYNVILKDDKRYPSLCIDTTQPFPNISVIRKRAGEKGLIFGPFTAGGAVKETVRVINRTFKLRKCKNKTVPRRVRPCLNYQIGACLAPCAMDVDPLAYHKIIEEVVLFLKGRTPDLIQDIKTEMKTAADAQDFEKAARLRDKMFALEKTLEKQIVVSSDAKDRDVFAIVSGPVYFVVTLLAVRNGFLRGSRNFKLTETLATESESLSTVIRQYYERGHFLPREILISNPMESVALLEDILSDKKGSRVSIKFPRRGEKKHLVDMAQKNAQKALREQTESETALAEMLHRLQLRLGLSFFPNRIECFDNSNISGTSAVAAMVVFEKGVAAKQHYRKYKIKTQDGPDDYGHMKEVLARRFHPLKAGDDLPNLVMVDGGKGQLNIAVDVLNHLQMAHGFDVIAIAKKNESNFETEDKIFKPNRVNPIIFGKDTDLLLFLQRIRDEAHRFAITFHRNKRKAASLGSVLDELPGIGKKRKAMLLKHFGSIKQIRAATVQEMAAVPGMSEKSAANVLAALKAATS